MSGPVGERAAPAAAGPPWLVPWLTAVAASVMVMVVLGGVVRLAGAGLSIVEWAPVTGILPPLSETAWERAFAAYRASPEYRLVHTGMELDEFRHIYWLEYLHRLLGRLAGLLLAIPLVLGLVRRRFDPATARALVAVGVLFALQGVMGWLMVASGLERQPWVSPYRLTAHLALALVLLAAVVWLLLRHGAGVPDVAARVLRRPARIALALVTVQILLGALVAGHKAGWMADTFPRMQGALIPPGLGGAGLASPLADPLTVHFEHRWFAFAALAAVLWLHGRARSLAVPPAIRGLVTAAAVLTLAQVGLGIAVVLSGMSPWLASAHQALGVLLFGMLVAVLQQTEAATGSPAAAPGATPTTP